jgi:hypothetical protein
LRRTGYLLKLSESVIIYFLPITYLSRLGNDCMVIMYFIEQKKKEINIKSPFVRSQLQKQRDKGIEITEQKKLIIPLPCSRIRWIGTCSK